MSVVTNDESVKKASTCTKQGVLLHWTLSHLSLTCVDVGLGTISIVTEIADRMYQVSANCRLFSCVVSTV